MFSIRSSAGDPDPIGADDMTSLDPDPASEFVELRKVKKGSIFKIF